MTYSSRMGATSRPTNLDNGLPAGPWATCPYCGEPPTDPSEEHLIPVAVGGEGLPPILGVCRECNTAMNRRVDQPLAGDRYIYAERMRLQIAGRRGAPTGRTLDVVEVVAPGAEGRHLHHRIKVRMTADGTLTGEGLVARTEGDGWITFVGTSREEIARQVTREKERLRGMGYRLRERVVADNVELNVRYRLPAEGGVLYDRAVAKTALAFVPRILGEDWSRGPKAALLRAVIDAESDQEREAVALGREVYPVNPRFAEQFELPDAHVVGLCAAEGDGGRDCTVLYASLFGRMLGAVEITDEALADEDCPVVLVDPVEHEALVLSLPTYLERRRGLRRQLEARAT